MTLSLLLYRTKQWMKYHIKTAPGEMHLMHIPFTCTHVQQNTWKQVIFRNVPRCKKFPTGAFFHTGRFYTSGHHCENNIPENFLVVKYVCEKKIVTIVCFFFLLSNSFLFEWFVFSFIFFSKMYHLVAWLLLVRLMISIIHTFLPFIK